MTTGKEAFESAAQLGVTKSYNYRQLSQIFYGINEAIEEIHGYIIPPGNGRITINDFDDNEVGEFTVNQDGPTVITLPEIGNGQITINDFDGNKVGEFTVNQDGPTVITLPETQVPNAVNPRGFIDVSGTAPSNPNQGDLYIQHRNDLADVVADASFVGIAGETITDGTYVLFGSDDEWLAGGNIQDVEGIQSDWNETDNTSLAFIRNKPCVYECNTYIPSLDGLP